MLKEFKEFAIKGNMVDMAIGIIIGAAFSTVVNSLVNDILMPIIAAVTGSPDFSNLFITLKGVGGQASVADARAAGDVVLALGLFINALISFLIVAWVLFMIVKAMNKLKRQDAAA